MDYQIIVYAICKNELQHLDKWLETYATANKIIIIDTGSTDGTYEKLQDYQRNMSQLYIEQRIWEPFDFGAAKDYALKKARLFSQQKPTIYCCFDLDEFLETNGLEYIKSNWQPQYDMIEILANVPADNWQCYVSHKIHSDNNKWHWIRPIHEILLIDHINESLNVQKMPVSYVHMQDKNKTRDYDSLLLYHLQQDPANVLSLRYLISEYTVQGKIQEAQYWLDKLENIPIECRGINGEPEESYYTDWRYLYHIFLTEDIIIKQQYAQLIFNTMQSTNEWFEFYIEKIYDLVEDHNKIQLLWQALAQNRLQQNWTDDFIYLELTLLYWKYKQYIKAQACAVHCWSLSPDNVLYQENLKVCLLSSQQIQNIKE